MVYCYIATTLWSNALLSWVQYKTSNVLRKLYLQWLRSYFVYTVSFRLCVCMCISRFLCVWWHFYSRLLDHKPLAICPVICWRPFSSALVLLYFLSVFCLFSLSLFICLFVSKPWSIKFFKLFCGLSNNTDTSMHTHTDPILPSHAHTHTHTHF